jgi:hypothetical protein
LTFDIAEFTEPLTKRFQARRVSSRSDGSKIADSGNFFRLLRMRFIGDSEAKPQSED